MKKTLFLLAIVFACSSIYASEAVEVNRIGYFNISNISADGSTVVGQTFGNNRVGYRWTASGGMQQMICPGSRTTSLSGVSGDGSTIVGTSWSNALNRNTAFIWSNNNYQVIDFSNGAGAYEFVAYDVSEDGTVVTGFGSESAYRGAFKWSSQTGGQHLGSINGGRQGQPVAIAGDGSTMVGYDRVDDKSYGVIWADGAVPISVGGLQYSKYTRARDVSYNGDVIVGDTYSEFPDGSYSTQAFKWTSDEGMVVLDFLEDGTYTNASAVSGDGKVIGGEAYNGRNAYKAVIWNDTGLHDFQDILTDRYDVDMSGWLRLGSIDAISKDGRTFAGTGIYQGQDTCWVVTIPEPMTFSLFAIGSIVAIRRQRQ